jgi:hypothetical protein
MKLFNKTIDRQLFKQYALGSDLSKQEAVVKIFNPMGAGTWFILNSDPQDPDYLWAIVDLGYGAEVGSVSRSDLETYRGKFGMGFERDLSFDPVNAEELYKGLRQGKFYAEGGEVSFIDYKDSEIMYEPHNKKYYAKDVEFDSLKEAQDFIDSGETDVRIRDAYSKGLFADGGLITEDKLKQEEWFSPDMKIMYQYKNGRLGITLFYGKNRRYSKTTVINNASELSIKELNLRVKKEIAELKQFAKEMLENNFADGGNLSRDRKFLNHSQDYEVRYSKGRNRKGYGFADGGEMQGKDTWQNILEAFGFKKGRSKYGLDMYYKRGYYASVDNELRNVDLMFEDDVLYRGYSVQGLLSALENHFGKVSFADGGNIENFTDNQRMIMNQNVELEHHHEELEDILEDEIPVPAWAVAKMATATQSISDVTHYLDGEKELMEDENEEEYEDEDEIKDKEVVEPINVSAGTKAELSKKFTDDALGNMKGFLNGIAGIDLRDDYTFDYKDEQFEIEPIINFDDNGASNAVFTIFDGDGEEQGEITYSREGGKQKFTANSEFFNWNNTKFEDGGYFDGTIPSVSSYMSTYAKGGEIAKAEVFGLKRNVMGTTDIEMKISGMRKAQDFIVYPIGADDAGSVITIQSDTRIGQLNLVKGVGVMSQSHSNGAYFVHLQMDKLTPFTVSESDLENIKSHIFKTAGSNVGTRGIVSDNSGASRLFADGGSFDKPFDVAYKTKSGRSMVALRIMAKNEEEAKQKLIKQMRSSDSFDKVHLAYPSFEDGGFMNNVYAKGGMVVTSIKDIPNFQERLNERRVTYRGLGTGKLYNDFYTLAGTSGTIIKVDGKEYFITDDEFNTFSRDANGNMRVRFSAPTRKNEDGGFMNDVYAKGGMTLIDGSEYEGYNLKDINGKKIEVGDTVKTTQPSGGVLSPADSEIGVVEKTKDAFGNDALQIKYRKQGTNYDRFILLNGKINEIVEKTGSFADGEDITPALNKKVVERAEELYREMNGKTKEDFDKAYYKSVTEFGYSPDVFIAKMEQISYKEDDYENYAKGGSLEDKLTKLENKKSDLESKLFDARLKTNEKWNNMGWGSGMRKSKLNLSTTREDSLKERIKAVEQEIEQIKEDMLPKKPKYILKSDIKTVTVKRNGKEVTYKGDDVLNGANVLAKGGDISSKANYIPKRDVIEVELKDGSKIKPVNGYWVKKGSEPVGAEPTPASSSSNETKVKETQIRKDPRGNWRAETFIEDFDGYDWRLTTVKTYSGQLISSAQGGKTMDSGSKGISMFKYAMYEDPHHTLEVSKPSRLTEKVVAEQHDKALAKFKKFMETGMFKGGGKISNFDKLSAKVAKQYEGKPVKNQYQEEYGKYYSKEEAQEVGDKVAGKVKAMQTPKNMSGGQTAGKKVHKGAETLIKANELAKEIRKEGESWLDAKRRAFAQLKK